MTAPFECPAWAQVDDLPVGVVDALDLAPEEWCGYLSLATDILWSATGRRWRSSSDTATVALRAELPRVGEPGWPYSETWGRCGCTGDAAVELGRLPVFGHHEPVAVRLPHPDVTGILAVTVDGQAFMQWRRDGSWLARTDGHGWPSCGDRTTVVYSHGPPPPLAGKNACVELAVELARSASPDPDQTCRLPQRVQQVTRQGITYETLDDIEFLDKGLTGLHGVDLWIRSVNPKNRSQAGRVWSPDIPRARSRT